MKIFRGLITFTILFSLTLGNTFVGCEGENDVPPPGLHIYTTRGHYDSLVCVKLSENKDEIVAFPSYSDGIFKYPIKLIDGYLLGYLFGGLNSAFLNISVNNYILLDSIVDFKQLILDNDPIIELYIDNNHIISRTAPDTSRLNEIIYKKDLNKYFIKLK